MIYVIKKIIHSILIYLEIVVTYDLKKNTYYIIKPLTTFEYQKLLFFFPGTNFPSTLSLSAALAHATWLNKFADKLPLPDASSPSTEPAPVASGALDCTWIYDILM